MNVVKLLLTACLCLAAAAPCRAAVAKVETIDGTPRLMIDGKADPGYAYATHFPPSDAELGSFLAAGVRLFQTFNSLDEFWKGPGVYDFSALDRGFGEATKKHPGALFFPRVGLNAPKWWLEKHSTETGVSIAGIIAPIQSLSSSVWRQEAGEALKALVKHVAASPYGDRVIGYLTWAGEEWTYRGAWWSDFTPYDASPAANAAFQEWLKRKYGSEAELRKAWGAPAASFATAAFPSKVEWLRGSGSLFRDPKSSAKVVDYSLFASETVADSVAHFAKVIKEASAGKAVTGCFYGYVLSSSMHFNDYSQQLQGHLALGRLLDCPDLDVVSTPANYRFRGPGEGWCSQTALQSVPLHGKLFMSEDDVRTPLSSDPCGRPGDFAAAGALFDKVAAWRAANGVSGWVVNFTTNPRWFDAPALMEQLRRAHALGAAFDQSPERPVAEIALFIDPACYLQFPPGHQDFSERIQNGYGAKRDKADFSGLSPLDFFTRAVSRLVNEELAMVGAPCHSYLLDDLGDPKRPDYKLNIIVSPVKLAPEQKRQIELRLKRGGHTVLWLFAPGIVDGDQLSSAAVSELTGMRLRFADEPVTSILRPTPESLVAAPVACRMLPGTHPICAGFGPELYFREDRPLSPILAVDDPDALTLGETTLDLYPFHRLSGLACKEFPGWKSVYSYAPLLPAKLLRNIAKYAGVHIYSEDGDFLSVGRGVLSVHCAGDGRHRVRLPNPTAVYSLDDARLLGEQLGEFEFEGKRGETHSFAVGQAAHSSAVRDIPPKLVGLNLLGRPGQANALLGWRCDKLAVTADGDAFRLTPQGSPASLCQKLELDGKDFSALEVTFKPREGFNAKLLFRIVGQDGASLLWDLGGGLERRTVTLDLRGEWRSAKFGLYVLAKDGQPAGSLDLWSLRLLESSIPVPATALKPKLVALPELLEWMCLAPFDDPGQKGLDLLLPPDGKLDLAAKHVGKAGAAIQWRRVSVKPGQSLMFPSTCSAVGYAATNLFAEKETPLLLLVGSDDGVAIWHDGKELWRNRVWRGASPEDDVIGLTLRPGWNQLLFKVNQGSQGWELRAQLATPDFRRPSGVKVSATLEL